MNKNDTYIAICALIAIAVLVASVYLTYLRIEACQELTHGTAVQCVLVVGGR